MTAILHHAALIYAAGMAALLAITFCSTACFVTVRRCRQRSGGATNGPRRPIL